MVPTLFSIALPSPIPFFKCTRSRCLTSCPKRRRMQNVSFRYLSSHLYARPIFLSSAFNFHVVLCAASLRICLSQTPGQRVLTIVVEYMLTHATAAQRADAAGFERANLWGGGSQAKKAVWKRIEDEKDMPNSLLYNVCSCSPPPLPLSPSLPCLSSQCPMPIAPVSTPAPAV